jgi:toxin ParE1/3/4
MKLRFTPRAIRNIADVADYLLPRDSTAAERVESDIYDSLESLILFPNIGRRQSAPGVRRLVTRQAGYKEV